MCRNLVRYESGRSNAIGRATVMQPYYSSADVIGFGACTGLRAQNDIGLKMALSTL